LKKTGSKAITLYQFEGRAPVPIALAAAAGDFVFVSGIGEHYFDPKDLVCDSAGNVLEDGSGRGEEPIEEQTSRTLAEIGRILQRAGCGFSDVVDVTVWLRDPRDFVGFNETYKRFLGAHRPARAVLRNAMMFRTRIEVKMIAYRPARRRGKVRAKATISRRGKK
jgi:enamine deaminase RidA (YjgF/YER057c/UK114 family)